MLGSSRNEGDYLVFRRPTWPWALMGTVLVLAACAFAGSNLAVVTNERIGQNVMMAAWFLLGASGALSLLVAASIYSEHVGIDEAAIEHLRLGRIGIRILWKDVDHVILHKSGRGRRGIIEVRGPKGRRIMTDSRLMRLDELETAVLERADTFGFEVKDYR